MNNLRQNKIVCGAGFQPAGNLIENAQIASAKGMHAAPCKAKSAHKKLSIINYQLSIRSAFTLIELLVVIIIIGLIAAIAIPSIANMKAAMAKSSAVNTVASTIKAARGLAGREKGSFLVIGGHYSGCAALFTPKGTVRFVVNDGTARYRDDTSIKLELMNKYKPNYRPDQINGYKDISGVDDVTLPSTAGVVGIYYKKDAGGVGHVEYLAPPFALRFTASGELQTSHTTGSTDPEDSWGFVYYNSKGDHVTPSNPNSPQVYDLSFSRDDYPDYDYTKWSSASAIGGNAIREDTNQLKLPFDRIEAVVGVMVYKKQDFKNAGFEPTDLNENSNSSGTNSNGETAAHWLAKHGHPILINRATGTIARGVVTTKGGS